MNNDSTLFFVVVTFVYFVVFVERGVAKRESELHKQTSLALPTNSHHKIVTDIDDIHSNEYPNAYPMFEIGRDLYFLEP